MNVSTISRILSTICLTTMFACEGGTPIAGLIDERLPPPATRVVFTSEPIKKTMSSGVKKILLGNMTVEPDGTRFIPSVYTLNLEGTLSNGDIQNLSLEYAAGNTFGDPIPQPTTSITFRNTAGATADGPTVYNLYGDLVSGVNRNFIIEAPNPQSIAVTDATGKRLGVVSPTGWPVVLAEVYIDQGNFTAAPDETFTTQLIQVPPIPEAKELAKINFSALGESYTVSVFSLTLYFDGGLTSDKLQSVRIDDNQNGFIGAVSSPIKPNNPRLTCSNIKRVVSNGGSSQETISATFVPGATGSITACLSNIIAQGDVSKRFVTLPEVCGHVMTVR